MQTHHIKASKETVRVGVISKHFPAILQIDSGDEIVFNTWGLWGNAVTPQTTLDEIVALRQAHAGKGPHSMTGPIAIKGALPGMMLQIDILTLKLGPYGFNLLTPAPRGRGLLSHQFSQPELRHFVFDEKRQYTELKPGFKLPLQPFLGILGVAPADDQEHASTFPDVFGGNIDCPELIAGTSLFLPVLVKDALFYAGDAHATQGCGEVNQTALETSMDLAHLRISLHPQQRLARPHAITAQDLVTMGFDPDLRVAASQAVDDMVSWLHQEYGLNRSEAYVLCSLKADLKITQAVNGNNGVHACLAKKLLLQ